MSYKYDGSDIGPKLMISRSEYVVLASNLKKDYVLVPDDEEQEDDDYSGDYEDGEEVVTDLEEREAEDEEMLDAYDQYVAECQAFYMIPSTHDEFINYNKANPDTFLINHQLRVLRLIYSNTNSQKDLTFNQWKIRRMQGYQQTEAKPPADNLVFDKAAIQQQIDRVLKHRVAVKGTSPTWEKIENQKMLDNMMQTGMLLYEAERTKIKPSCDEAWRIRYDFIKKEYDTVVRNDKFNKYWVQYTEFLLEYIKDGHEPVTFVQWLNDEYKVLTYTEHVNQEAKRTGQTVKYDQDGIPYL